MAPGLVRGGLPRDAIDYRKCANLVQCGSSGPPWWPTARGDASTLGARGGGDGGRPRDRNRRGTCIPRGGVLRGRARPILGAHRVVRRRQRERPKIGRANV